MIAGDPNGEAVLRELADDPAPHVQGLANFALRRMESAEDTVSDAVMDWIVRYTMFDAR